MILCKDNVFNACFIRLQIRGIFQFGVRGDLVLRALSTKWFEVETRTDVKVEVADGRCVPVLWQWMHRTSITTTTTMDGFLPNKSSTLVRICIVR